MFPVRGEPLMPAAAPAAPTLRDRLKSLRDDVSAARDERAEAMRARDDAREAYARADVPESRLMETEEFKRAERAVERLNAINDRLEDLQGAERGILAMLGEAGTPAPGSAGATGANPDAVNALTRSPGVLLASILERRKAEVPTLPDHLRFKLAAMQTPLTTGEVSTVTEGEAVIDLLSPASVAMASGIQTPPIDTTKARVPRFTDLPTAAWIPELGAFPKNGPAWRWSTSSRRRWGSSPRSALRSSRTCAH
jgi:hypothetical protein